MEISHHSSSVLPDRFDLSRVLGGDGEVMHPASSFRSAARHKGTKCTLKVINATMRFVHIILYITVCCGVCTATANDSCLQNPVSPDSINADMPRVVREQISHSKFERITFSDASCDTTYSVNQGIKHYELSEYIKSQDEKLQQMSLEILNVFTDDDLAAFKTLKVVPIIQCQLTVSKDGRIIDTSLIIQAKVSPVISDRRLRDIKEIVTHTSLDVIPYQTSAVRFYYGVPRELFARLL